MYIDLEEEFTIQKFKFTKEVMMSLQPVVDGIIAYIIKVEEAINK